MHLQVQKISYKSSFFTVAEAFDVRKLFVISSVSNYNCLENNCCKTLKPEIYHYSI